jgi:MFS family permease
MLTCDPSPAAPIRMKSNYKWTVVGMLWLVCVLNYGDRQAFFSVFREFKDQFGFNAVQLGLMGSAFAWVYALGSPVAGFIGDRISRKGLILGSCVFWSVATALTAGCGQLWQFVGVRALTGLGETFYFPSALSLMSAYHGSRTRSLALSIHQSGVYVGTVAGGWAGAAIAEHYGWRTGFGAFGAAGILLSLVLVGTLREPKRTEAGPASPPPLTPGEAWAEIVRWPAARVLMVVFAGANFVATIFLAWAPLFLAEKYHLSLTNAGIYGVAFISIASAVSAPIGGATADILARRTPGGRIWVQAFGLLAGAAFIALVGLTDRLAILLVSMAIVGLCKGLYDSNIFASLYDFVSPRARSSAAGVMNTVGWCGGALGPVAVGFATQYGRHGTDAVANMGEAIAFGAVIYAAGGAALAVVASRSRRPGLAAESAA